MAGHRRFVRGAAVDRRGAHVVVKNTLLEVRCIGVALGVAKDPAAHSTCTAWIPWHHAGWHNVIVVEGVLVPGERHLMEIADAGGGLSLGFGFGQSRQEHSCQDGDNGYDDQQLDEREGRVR